MMTATLAAAMMNPALITGLTLAILAILSFVKTFAALGAGHRIESNVHLSVACILSLATTLWTLACVTDLVKL